MYSKKVENDENAEEVKKMNIIDPTPYVNKDGKTETPKQNFFLQ